MHPFDKFPGQTVRLLRFAKTFPKDGISSFSRVHVFTAWGTRFKSWIPPTSCKYLLGNESGKHNTYLICRMFVDFEMLPFWWNSRTISLRPSHEDIWKINDKPRKRIYNFVRLVAKLQKCKPWRGDICPTGWKSTRSSWALDEGWLSPTVLTLKRFLAIKTTAIGAAFWVDYDKHSFFWNCWLPLSVRLEMTDFLPNEGIDNNHSKTIVLWN